MGLSISCCIIGQGKLTVMCAQMLLDRGHSIKAMVSANTDVCDWAQRQNIPCIMPAEDQHAFLSQFDFEFLFSIINPNKISNQLLSLPTRRAVNFHDAPLPRYAGLHVTSWAIANRETDFGVTWHEITEQFDAGQILKQREFPLAPDETAFSLNVKCFEHGKSLFSELIDELADGRESLLPQDLTQRSSYLSTKRPDAAGILDWSKSAEDLEALVRALSYQPDPNPIGMPKMVLANKWYLVLEVELCGSGSVAAGGSNPGYVKHISAAGIEVQTGTSTIRVRSLQSLDGTLVDFLQLVESTGLKSGDELQVLGSKARNTIHELDHLYGKNEKFWRQRLQHVEPFVFSERALNVDVADACITIEKTLPANLVSELKQVFPEQCLVDGVVGLFSCFLKRLTDVDQFDIRVGYYNDKLFSALHRELFVNDVLLSVSIDNGTSVRDSLRSLSESLHAAETKAGYVSDLHARWPELKTTERMVGVEVRESAAAEDIAANDSSLAALTLILHRDSDNYSWQFNPRLLDNSTAEQLFSSFEIFLQNVAAEFSSPLSAVAIIGELEKEKLLVEWNQTEVAFDEHQSIHQMIEAQVAQHPNQVALTFRDTEITYKELDQRANILASELQRLGAAPDIRIGLFIERSIDMMVGLLGILKSGAAYVPLDPAYPRDRVALMIDDAQCPILVTHAKLLVELPSHQATTVCVDQLTSEPEASVQPVVRDVAPNNLAYVIYTSGSTGKPKGVMVEHRNVVNFFAGMDQTLEYDGKPGVWLAVTSISFDISVLELFWSLSRGFKVVIQEEDARTLAQDAVSTVSRKLDVGLFYFSSDAGPSDNTNRYKLLLEGAKFADSNDFSSVWTPERHFHLFGGLYPNPSVTSAAIAAVTSRVAIRAGSIVLPLHNPVRVAEEWSVVDNLSGGRVGFSFASGWHANDFSLMPENYSNRKQLMYDGIDVLRNLWSGESVTMTNGEGNPFTAKIYPVPVQKMPPMWITTAGNIDSFRAAGEGGFNVLTNLLGQSIDDIKEKIAAYRQGRKDKGHEGDGNVSVMVHTFIGSDVELVREIVRKPFCSYLKTSFDLVKVAPWAFPAFRQPSKSAAQDSSFDASALTDEDMDALLDHAFDRYFETAGLFGTASSCIPLIDELKNAGVDEVACLIDFGVDDDLVLENLPYLSKLRTLANPLMSIAGDFEQQDFSVAAQIQRHQVTHFQCTPSMARILSTDPDTLQALGSVQKFLLGGEALPIDLATTLTSVCTGEVINVYGPTETTIWSTSSKVPADPRELSIGRPIANTKIYILDRDLQPTPIGLPGELFIGGKGVVRGYLDRPDLTAERFIDNPFEIDSDHKVYRTGDLVKYRNNGDIEYLGRLDHQVKLRGYRIELGEIESLICTNAGVRDCVLSVVGADNNEESDVQRLVAYVVPSSAGNEIQDNASSSDAVQYWQTIWDQTYQASSQIDQDVVAQQNNADPTFNISGWLNSYTGEQHSEHAMREWLDAIVERILAHKPRRVLEIGCGTGMILYRVAPHCEHYTGVDLSQHALDLIGQQALASGLSQVSLVQQAADTLSWSDFSPADNGNVEPFDLVIINSVVQYFPSAEYLVKVLENIAGFISTSGKVFVGDVRSLPLMKSFHHSLELAKAPAALSLADLNTKVIERHESETELLVAPDFFLAIKQNIAQINNVDIQLKRGESSNEMSAFRYDVLLDFATQNNIVNEDDFAALPTPANLAEVKECLAAQNKSFVLRDIINPRLEPHVFAYEQMSRQENQTVETVAALQTQLDARAVLGIDPEQIYQLDTGGKVQLLWAKSGRLDCYDAYFNVSEDQCGAPMGLLEKPLPLHEYCNNPLQGHDELALIDRLKSSLQDKLPEFMVPDIFMLLPRLPLTPNGKIDRKALPVPEKRQREAEEEYVAPAGDIEQVIAGVLQEMLNLEKIGTRDNFFNMGANSLLIVQANNRLSQMLERKVSLVSMYRYPTIASLAEFLGGNLDTAQGAEKGQQRGEKRKAAQENRKRRNVRRRT